VKYRARFISVLLISLSATIAIVARAQTAPQASILNDVRIDQKLDTQIPADLTFKDENGATVQLGQYYGKRPMVLVLVYYKCPMLCTMVLNDLNKVIGAMKMNVGEQFDIVTVSFDPSETPELAAKKKHQYVRAYNRPHAEEGWHFLTGDEDNIKKLTEAVGFHYAWDEKFKQYAHASGIMVLTPEGKTSKYFYGVEYSAVDLRLSLTEAAGGKISAPVEQVLLYCFHYDPATGKYSLMVTRMVQIGAILTMGAIGTFWFMMWRAGKNPNATTNVTTNATNKTHGNKTNAV
jgi:protein SCO1/2